MRSLHLHPFGWNVPPRLLHVELRPAGADQLGGSQESECHQLNAQTGVLASHIPVDSPQQLRHLPGCYARIVTLLAGLQNIGGLHVRNRVALDQIIGHAIPRACETL
jgi:hypothetical protein